uniref:NXPE C-terminal domain-containing protein n=1 Tax=Sphenodon punctatus TaxID=8508 RepID=A0A8D0HMC3_SPHPU
MSQGSRAAAVLWIGVIFSLGIMYRSSRHPQPPQRRLLPPLPAGPKATRTQPPPPPPRTTSLEATELLKLLKLIEWPAPQEAAVPFQHSTSPTQSQYRLLHPNANYSVGGTLLVRLEARDHRRQPKPYGGDLFRAKLHSPAQKAGVVGSVQDHRNGTYTLAFPLLWAGDVAVSVRLIHSSEAVGILRHIRDSQPSTVAFLGYFLEAGKPGPEEVTECNVHPLPDPATGCEYTDSNTGEHWFCVRPQRFPCSALVHHSAGRYKPVVAANESAFLSGNVTDQIVPDGHLPPLHVLMGAQQVVASPVQRCVPGLEPRDPPGFYYNDLWVSLSCMGRSFSTPALALACLKGKIIHMIGDSTLRQWWEYLLGFIPSLKRIDLHVTYQSGPLLAVEMEQGLVLRWRAHGNPLRTSKTLVADLHYTANELDGLGGGPDMVVVFTLWAHFTTFPIELYVQRLQTVRRAVAKLLSRSPGTTVLIKSANTGYKSVYGSDWLSLQLDRILREMFAGMPVVIIDAWAMTACHYLPDNIHPGKVIVRNEVDVFLSYVCPQPA